MIDLNEFKKEVHELAVEKGWYEEKREMHGLVLLIQSELFEAFECWRKKDFAVRYEENGKPCGLPSEFADMVIRLLDMAGYYEIEIIFDYSDEACFDIDDFVKWVFNLNTLLCNYDFMAKTNFFSLVISEIWRMAEHMGIDLEKAVIEKHEYNKTRPYRHGNKLA